MSYDAGPDVGQVQMIALAIGVIGSLIMFGLSLRSWLRARSENMEAEPIALLIVNEAYASE